MARWGHEVGAAVWKWLRGFAADYIPWTILDFFVYTHTGHACMFAVGTAALSLLGYIVAPRLWQHDFLIALLVCVGIAAGTACLGYFVNASARTTNASERTQVTLNFVEGSVLLTAGLSAELARAANVPAAKRPWESITFVAHLRCHNPGLEEARIKQFLVELYTHSGKRATMVPPIDSSVLEGWDALGHGFNSFDRYSLVLPVGDSFFRVRFTLKYHRETTDVLNTHVVRVTARLSDGTSTSSTCKIDWDDARQRPHTEVSCMPA